MAPTWDRRGSLWSPRNPVVRPATSGPGGWGRRIRPSPARRRPFSRLDSAASASLGLRVPPPSRAPRPRASGGMEQRIGLQPSRDRRHPLSRRRLESRTVLDGVSSSGARVSAAGSAAGLARLLERVDTYVDAYVEYQPPPIAQAGAQCPGPTQVGASREGPAAEACERAEGRKNRIAQGRSSCSGHVQDRRRSPEDIVETCRLSPVHLRVAVRLRRSLGSPPTPNSRAPARPTLRRRSRSNGPWLSCRSRAGFPGLGDVDAEQVGCCVPPVGFRDGYLEGSDVD